jgi:hypothetical protein
MNKQQLLPWLVAVLTAFFCSASPGLAQAPGEDPVVLSKKLVVQMQPWASPTASQGLDNFNGMSSGLRARVARYEARAFSSDTSGILTNNDVVATSNAEGMQKTCVQEVGSNTLSSSTTGSAKYGPNQAPQVVVLRGDLVNICR